MVLKRNGARLEGGGENFPFPPLRKKKGIRKKGKEENSAEGERSNAPLTRVRVRNTKGKGEGYSRNEIRRLHPRPAAESKNFLCLMKRSISSHREGGGKELSVRRKRHRRRKEGRKGGTYFHFRLSTRGVRSHSLPGRKKKGSIHCHGISIAISRREKKRRKKKTFLTGRGQGGELEVTGGGGEGGRRGPLRGRGALLPSCSCCSMRKGGGGYFYVQLSTQAKASSSAENSWGESPYTIN